MLESITGSLKSENWYAALAVALTVPDVGGALEHADEKATPERYGAWFEKWLAKEYGFSQFHQFVWITGKQCYELRCALLHNSSDDISTPHFKKTL
jgi:hypothetical protein